ncbi:hypothetical protein [Salinicola acroporae]|uniref:Uncharacterized protein n=1 Tax=Salinicola acroporae TaxID=1541440 RepID=A0ABT6I5A4_9GAMM|nr:hypothetical protein [Salinicola acroporae]MDH4572706.1 hypothetical protein [Salinicola acroporae]
MNAFVVRHSAINETRQAPEWLVVNQRYDEGAEPCWIMSRHAFQEEAEMEAERLNGNDTAPIGSVD